jgi:AcrR family transcriptional regulator
MQRNISEIDGRLSKGREMREKILLATLELAGEKGISALSARTLSEKVGISKANLFHHFKNMQEIRVEACLYFLKIIRPQAIEEKEYSDPRVYLLELMNKIADFLEKNRILVKGYNIIGDNEARINDDFMKLIDSTVQGNKGVVKKQLREIMTLDENDQKTEEILFCLDIAREGYIVYLTSSFMKEKVLKSWETTVDIMLEKLR